MSIINWLLKDYTRLGYRLEHSLDWTEIPNKPARQSMMELATAVWACLDFVDICWGLYDLYLIVLCWLEFQLNKFDHQNSYLNLIITSVVLKIQSLRTD